MIKKEVIVILVFIFGLIALSEMNITGLVTSNQVSSLECRNREIKIASCNLDNAKMVIKNLITPCFPCTKKFPSILMTRSSTLILPRGIKINSDCTREEREFFISELKRQYHSYCMGLGK